MELNDALEAFAPVALIFEELEIDYQLGGSVASSIHGFPRGTLDVDVEADLKLEHVKPLVERLEDDWMITREMVSDAIRHQSSFNILPFESIAKVDIFVRKQRAFDLNAAKRRVKNLVLEDGTLVPFFVDSVEDTVLRKLVWYRMGGHVSDMKWLDVLGVLKAQFFDVDVIYLEKWAAELGISDLLDKALDESGLKETL